MKYITNSIKETKALAAQMAKSYQKGQVIGLVGDLGSGKTAFTQGLAKALGVKTIVNSPTFVLMKLYPVKHKTIKTLVHVDAYRLEALEGLGNIGLEEYFDDPSVLVVIEWADKIKLKLPKNTRYIYFKQLAETRRQLSLKK